MTTTLIQQPHGGDLTPPWKKGQSGNPAGRKTCGAYVSEWINSLTHRQATEKTLRRLMKKKSSPVALKIACNRLLAMMERPDMADFEPLADGQLSVRELRKAGIDTAAIKKWEPKRTRITRRKEGEAEIVEEVMEAKIELFDRSLPSFEKVLDRTDGVVKGDTNVTVNVAIAEIVSRRPTLPDPTIVTDAKELPDGPV